MELRHQQTWQNQLQTPHRDCYCEEPNQINVYCKSKHSDRDTFEFTHSLLGVNGKAAHDPYGRRQDVRDSGLDVASFDHCDISAQQEVEVQSFSESQESKCYSLRNVRDGRTGTWRYWSNSLAVAKRSNWQSSRAVDTTIDSTSNTFDRHEEFVASDSISWRQGKFSWLEMVLLDWNTVDTSRRVILRNTPRYSHDSLGHCESSIEEVEKQIRVFVSHTWRADHNAQSTLRSKRHYSSGWARTTMVKSRNLQS